MSQKAKDNKSDYLKGFDMPKRLAELRTLNGVGPQEAARIAGVEEEKYLAMEQSTRADSNDEGLNSVQVFLLCKAFGISLNEFFWMEPERELDLTQIDLSDEDLRIMKDIIKKCRIFD